MSSEGCGKEVLRRLKPHCEKGRGAQGAGECPEANWGGGELLITEGTGEIVQSNLQSLYLKYEKRLRVREGLGCLRPTSASPGSRKLSGKFIPGSHPEKNNSIWFGFIL